MADNGIAVVTIGGNSLIKDNTKKEVRNQIEAIKETCGHIADMIELGWDKIVIGHGNGPQVGFLLRRVELALQEVHNVPLEILVADTQGSIGYMIQQSLANEFRKRNINKKIVTIVTQVLVDKDDQAFKNPSKPIGSFMNESTAKEMQKKENWIVREDAGRGWRRVVPSPFPKEIIELDVIKSLLNEGIIVVTVGGGGIPVIMNENQELEGVAAVIDKDNSSSLLASKLEADLFLISTGVDKVYINFGKENQQALDNSNITDLKKYLDEGHFAPGSMQPKIKSILAYFENGGKKAIITNPENIGNALKGKNGTHIE